MTLTMKGNLSVSLSCQSLLHAFEALSLGEYTFMVDDYYVLMNDKWCTYHYEMPSSLVMLLVLKSPLPDIYVTTPAMKS